jgi:predicted RNase H-like HicB family nuclease
MFPLKVEMEEEEDRRWVADIPALPGVMVYGNTSEEARAKVEELALVVLLDRMAE